MEAKHTPGPWTSRSRNIWGPKGQHITFAPHHCEAGVTFDEAMSNATLIAAAPDLLAALSDLLIIADEAGCDTLSQKRARAAIAKARGQS